MRDNAKPNAPPDFNPWKLRLATYPLLLLGFLFLALLPACSTTPSAPATPRLPEPPPSLQKKPAPLPPLPRSTSAALPPGASLARGNMPMLSIKY